jgi:hypothetical protein
MGSPQRLQLKRSSISPPQCLRTTRVGAAG